MRAHEPDDTAKAPEEPHIRSKLDDRINVLVDTAQRLFRQSVNLKIILLGTETEECTEPEPEDGIGFFFKQADRVQYATKLLENVEGKLTEL